MQTVKDKCKFTSSTIPTEKNTRTHITFQILESFCSYSVYLKIAFYDKASLKWSATFPTAVSVWRMAGDKRTSWQTTSPIKWRMQCAWHLYFK